MNVTDDDISRGLADVPPLPQTVFDGVTQGIRRRRTGIRVAWAVAATIALAAGTGTFAVRGQFASPQTQLAQDVSDQLDWARDFLNGNDIDSELKEYAVLSGDAF